MSFKGCGYNVTVLDKFEFLGAILTAASMSTLKKFHETFGFVCTRETTIDDLKENFEEIDCDRCEADYTYLDVEVTGKNGKSLGFGVELTICDENGSDIDDDWDGEAGECPEEAYFKISEIEFFE